MGLPPGAAQVAALRPELATDPAAAALLTTWNDDPWAGESYFGRTPSPWPPATRTSSPPRWAGSISRASTRPVPGAGLMEGALRSGERAAREVLASTLT